MASILPGEPFPRRPGPIPLPPGPVPGPRPPGPGRPSAPPAGPIGQGYLTPFGETTPQIFQNVGGILGGFSGEQQQPLYDSFMSNRNYFKPGKSRSAFPTWPSPGGDYASFWNQLISSGSLSPQGLHFLLGMSRPGVQG